MAALKTICPVCESNIVVEQDEIKIATVQRGKTGGQILVGCPACARVLVIPDAPEKGVFQWLEKMSNDPDWLGCVPLLNADQAKIPAGSEGDLAYIKYRPGGGGEPLPRREYMVRYGIDPKIHCELNPGLGNGTFVITDSRR